jgi:hypothetical protein
MRVHRIFCYVWGGRRAGDERDWDWREEGRD